MAKNSARTRERAPHVNQVPNTQPEQRESQKPNSVDDSPIRQRIEALAEIICGGGEECAGALLVLMGMLEDSAQPEVLAHTVKHFAFTRCGELNVFGMVDAQIAAVERELRAN
jgi:hypothetical protein